MTGNLPNIKELRQWLATEVMGWQDFGGEYGYYGLTKEPGQIPEVVVCKQDTSFGPGWRPDDPTTGYIEVIIDKMIQDGFTLALVANKDGKPWALFFRVGSNWSPRDYVVGDTRLMAILNAAWVVKHPMPRTLPKWFDVTI